MASFLLIENCRSIVILNKPELNLSCSPGIREGILDSISPSSALDVSCNKIHFSRRAIISCFVNCTSKVHLCLQCIIHSGKEQVVTNREIPALCVPLESLGTGISIETEGQAGEFSIVRMTCSPTL